MSCQRATPGPNGDILRGNGDRVRGKGVVDISPIPGRKTPLILPSRRYRDSWASSPEAIYPDPREREGVVYVVETISSAVP